MKFKSFDRFFVFVLALSTALYFFGAKTPLQHSAQHAAASVSAHVTSLDNSSGALIPPEGVETKEEQASEDDEPTDSDESVDHNVDSDIEADSRTSSLNSHPIISASQRAFHCPLHIRLRTILI